MRVQINTPTPAFDGGWTNVIRDDTTGNKRSRTDIRQVGGVLGSGMTESTSSLFDLDARVWVVRVDALDGGVEIDKVLDEITK